MDRLAGVRAKLADAEKQKAETEKAKAEKEAKVADREKITFELAARENEYQENVQALQQIAEMESQAEGNPEVQSEMATIKQEAQQEKDSYEALKVRLATLDQELSALEGGEAGITEVGHVEAASEVAAVETVAEATVEAAPAGVPIEDVQEKPAETPVEAVEAEKSTEVKPEAAAEKIPSDEAQAEAVEAQELTNEQVVEFVRQMEALEDKSVKAKTAEEIEDVFKARVAMLDQMKDAKFPDILTAPDGTTESGKDFGDSIKSGESLESFKLSRDARLEDIKAAQVSVEAPAEAATVEAPVEGAAAKQSTEAQAEAVEAQELTNEQVVEFVRQMEALEDKSVKAKTAEEIEDVFKARVAMLDQMKDAKFPDILTAPDGTTESGKDFGDSIKSGESLESFKLSRDARLEDIKAAQVSVEAPAEAAVEVPVEAVVAEAPVEAPAGVPIEDVQEKPAETPVEAVEAEKSTEVKPEAAAEKIPSDLEKEKIQDASFDKVDNDWKQERPDILAKLQKEGKIKEGETSIPRAEYMKIVDQGFDERLQKGELAEAVLYRMAMENKLPRGMASEMTVESAVQNLDPALFSERLSDLKKSLLTTEQQKTLENSLMRNFVEANKKRGSGSERFYNFERNALNYVDKNPEKIDEFADRAKESLTTLEEAEEKRLVSSFKEKARSDKKFMTKVLEQARANGMGREAEPGGFKLNKDEIAKLAKDFEGDVLDTPVKKEEHELYAADNRWKSAKDHMGKYGDALKKIGPKGEAAFEASLLNYAEAVSNFAEKATWKGLDIAYTLKRFLDDAKNIPNTDARGQILANLERAAASGKGKSKDVYEQKDYEEIQKKIQEELASLKQAA